MLRSTLRSCRNLYSVLAGTGLMLIALAANAQKLSLPPEPDEAAATLSRTEAPAQGVSDVLLTVQKPGRLRIKAESATGVALQFVDMMVGPSAITGEPGIRDGVVDELADRSTYKIRILGKEGGKGNAKLSVEPYRKAAPASTEIVRGGSFSSNLADLQQRSFWLIIDQSGDVNIEAGGRALQDIALWRNGTERVTIERSFLSVEPKPGRGLTLIRISGKVEPGLYLVTAYGGSPIPWTDGAKEQPFHIRFASPKPMIGSSMEGVIGPLGVSRISLPSSIDYLRLELPSPAPARLIARRGKNTKSAVIQKNSRNSVISVQLPVLGNEPGTVDIIGQEGQSFSLRALATSTPKTVTGQGPFLVGAEFAGTGSEEAPAMAILSDIDDKGSGRVIASDAPRIGPGNAWRGKFNLRGLTTLIFEVTQAGPIAVFSEGANATFSIDPIRMKSEAPVKNIKSVWDVGPGWYWLTIRPVNDARGIIDVTVGPPGTKPNSPTTLPARTGVEFGQILFENKHSYQFFTSSSPSQVSAPRAWPLPLDLSSGSPSIRQSAKKNLQLPIRMPFDGDLLIYSGEGKLVTAKRLNEGVAGKERTLTLDIPATDGERVLTLVWKKPDTAPTTPVVERSELPKLEAGKSVFFDLNRDQTRSFRIDVAQGGLYRVETTGRLKTKLALGTAFRPNIASAEDNGVGHNALLQTYLRSGSYNVTVAVSDSDGHLGLSVTPSPLMDMGTLAPESSLRTTLSGGRGAIFMIDIPTTGKYSLELQGLNRSFTARLEDSEGWPLTIPNRFERLEQQFVAGKYRLVVQPEAIDARAVVRLNQIPQSKDLKGHGPHSLVFNKTQEFQWREPENKDAPRDPDIWTFTLAAQAQITISLSDGMVADLIRRDSGSERVGRIVNGHDFSSKLEPGRYALEARSLGRNDRLDYQVTVEAEEIQPDVPLHVELPAKVPFAVSENRVVNITTFGGLPLKAVLKDASGREIETMTGRNNDWNIALSRYLAAGRYTLELNETKVFSGQSDSSAESENSSDESNKPTVEVQFSLPEPAEAVPLSFQEQKTVTESRVHSFILPTAESGKLVVIAAQSIGEIALSVEKRMPDGQWLSQGFVRNNRPVIAFPADHDKTSQWRLSVWRIDGGFAPITVAARMLDQAAQPVGQIKLEPVTIEGFDRPIHVATIDTTKTRLVRIIGHVSDLVQGSNAATLLRPFESGIIAAQSNRLWLVAKTSATISLESVSILDGEIALELGKDEKVILAPEALQKDKIFVWQADSTFGQPTFLSETISPNANNKTDINKSARMNRPGIAPGSALALGRDLPLSVKNGDAGALRLTLKGMRLDLQQRDFADTGSSITIPAKTAFLLKLSAGGEDKNIGTNMLASIEAGLAVFPNMTEKLESFSPPIWAANTVVSRWIHIEHNQVMVINTNDKPATASFSRSRSVFPKTFAHGSLIKRFFGSGGSLAFNVEATPEGKTSKTSEDKITVLGATATFVGDDGTVQRGSSLSMHGMSGYLMLDYSAGLVAAWFNTDQASAWPNVVPTDITIPNLVMLDGPAKRFRLKATTPSLLEARTDAPIILSWSQAGRNIGPQLHSDGAEFQTFVQAGEFELRIDSPHTGPLSGTLDLSLSPIPTIDEGLGEPIALAPGATALFGFDVTKLSTIGAGVRAMPDNVTSRILNAEGHPLGTGVVQMLKLAPGRYYLEVKTPATGPTVTLQTAIIGLKPPPSGVPADIQQKYLEMVGKTTKRAQRG